MSKIEQNKTFYQLISEPLIIPDYQRDYAQGRVNDLKILETRRIFIGDIIEASTNRRQTHLGLVFGSDNNGLNGFVAVDGQQRLTTCFLFHLYISKSLSNNAESGLFERLRNFGWHGRIYASEFTDFLFDTDWKITDKIDQSLSGKLQQSKDYFYVWEKDPTVNNMLVILDEIHSQMGKLEGYSTQEIESNLISDECLLNFDYMKLEEGTDEFQYQKMNSRGRDLTTYELFKQRFMRECDVSEDVKDKLDNRWLIFFDKLAIENNSEADIFLQNYINETALWMGVKYSGESYQFVSQIGNSKVKGNRTDVGFVGFGAYKEFCEHLSEWEQITDWLVANYAKTIESIEHFWYEDESTRFIDIFESADYQARTINYAICHYAKVTGFGSLNEDNFKLWWRPVHNLIANTDIYQSKFPDVLKAIEKLPADNLYSYLKDSSISGFSEYQSKEERRKAIMCLDQPDMTELFADQEKRQRFHGQIGLLLPDDNHVTTQVWKTVVSTYENLVGDRYIYGHTSDFDFITAVLTFVGEDYGYDTINGLRLKYETGHLRGQKIPARWIHKMIFQYMDQGKIGEAVTPAIFFQNCRETWLEKYSMLSYEDKKNYAWIKYILENYEECYKVFSDSHYGKITKKDGNLWLYLKTNKNEKDILLSNKRKAVIERLADLEDWWISDHDVVKRYSDYPYLKVVFVSNNIWVGISRNSGIDIPNVLPDYIWSGTWNIAWTWFPSDILNNFHEHEHESFEQYIENLSRELRKFCLQFVESLNLTNKDIIASS